MHRLNALLGAGLIATAFAGCVSSDDASSLDPSTSVAASPDPTGETGSIVGRVLDEEQLPVAGAEVAVLKTHLEGRTDATGAFTFNAVEPGSHHVVFQKIGYTYQTRSVVVTADQVTYANVTLDATEVFLDPIVDSEPFQGHLRCAWNPYYSLNSCGEVLGGNINHWAFQLRPEAELMRVIVEVDWVPTTSGTGQTLEVDVCPPQDAQAGGNTIMCADLYYFASGGPPLRMDVEAEFLPWADVKDYEVWVGAGFQDPMPAYDQQFTLYLTRCYVVDCPDFSALPSEA